MSGAPPSAREISRSHADTFSEMSVQTLIVSASPAHVAAALETSGVGVYTGRLLLLLQSSPTHSSLHPQRFCLRDHLLSVWEKTEESGSAALSKRIFSSLVCSGALQTCLLSASMFGPATSVLCPFSFFGLLISVP